MIDLEKKQAFWAEQLPNFEAKYWLPNHFEFLIFDTDQGNYVIKDGLDPSFEDEATEIFHRVNTGWAMWKKAINFNDQQAEIDSLKAQLAKLNEGWLMVPKELNTVAAANIANTIFTKNESYISNENRAMTKSEYQNFKERWIAHKAKNIQQNYKELIEAAQENSHE